MPRFTVTRTLTGVAAVERTLAVSVDAPTAEAALDAVRAADAGPHDPLAPAAEVRLLAPPAALVPTGEQVAAAADPHPAGPADLAVPGGDRPSRVLVARDPVTRAELEAAVRAVVGYLWADERADFLDQDEDGQEDHVFRSLVTLDSWLDRRRYDPEAAAADGFPQECDA